MKEQSKKLHEDHSKVEIRREKLLKNIRKEEEESELVLEYRSKILDSYKRPKREKLF